MNKKDYKPTSIRLPPKIYEQVKKDAEENERSISMQITTIIKEYLRNKGSSK